nr:protein BPS1, chloroplastic-like [Ipomoea batatas]GME06861.1 protein BPS1, chloroplastic-like [Ipomoea batatas]
MNSPRNPFRKIFPKGSHLSSRLLSLLNTFEESVAEKLKSLRPLDGEDVLSLSWMQRAIAALSVIHSNIKALLTALELPVSDWDEKWIDVYLDNSVRLLDVCTALSSEISRLNQGNLFIRCTLHNVDGGAKKFVGARSSLDGWKQHLNGNNLRLEKCFGILDGLTESLNLPKIKNSAKGKVLMRALYGVRAVTVSLCSIFVVAFSGSVKKLKDLEIPEDCIWAKAFLDLQAFINKEIRDKYSCGGFKTLKELEGVDISVEKLYPMVKDGVVPTELGALQDARSDLSKKADQLSEGLDLLSKEVDAFFQILLSGRNALLSNLRIGSKITNQMPASSNLKGQIVR